MKDDRSTRAERADLASWRAKSRFELGASFRKTVSAAFLKIGNLFQTELCSEWQDHDETHPPLFDGNQSQAFGLGRVRFLAIGRYTTFNEGDIASRCDD